MIPRKLPRKQDCSASDEDYISNLPEDIICRIISCLPTIDAVKMSVLSKQWENKWTSINNIEITDEKRKMGRRKDSKESGVAFINFMRRITTRVTNVRKFCMCLAMNYKVSKTRSWIFEILKNQIKSLHVETPAISSTRLILRGSLLKTTSLEQLVLNETNFRVPNNILFRSLISLDLDHVYLSNENSRSDTLVLNFPTLKTLKVSECRWLVKLVEIHAPTLTTFSSANQNYSGELTNHTINIHGDMLVNFASTGGKVEDIFVIGSTVVSAKFENLCEEDVEPIRIWRLLKKFAFTLDQLVLTFNVAKAISNQEVSLTCFAKLRRLNLDGYHYEFPLAGNMYGYTQLLLELLHAMPCLKCLKLRVSYWDDFDYAAVDYIPSCFTSSLEKIEFEYNEPNPAYLLLLAKFLMKTTLRLKEFFVHHYNKEFEDGFLEKISSYPTGSSHVKIVGSSFHQL